MDGQRQSNVPKVFLKRRNTERAELHLASGPMYGTHFKLDLVTYSLWNDRNLPAIPLGFKLRLFCRLYLIYKGFVLHFSVFWGNSKVIIELTKKKPYKKGLLSISLLPTPLCRGIWFSLDLCEIWHKSRLNKPPKKNEFMSNGLLACHASHCFSRLHLSEIWIMTHVA